MRARDFLGRDLRQGESGFVAISVALDQEETATIGTFACVPWQNNWKARSFCSIRNFLFRIGLIKGYNGILLANHNIGGYDKSRSTFEHIDRIRRDLAHGAKWVFLQDVYVQIDMRRYENRGYTKTLFWWLIEAVRYKLGLPSREWTVASDLKKEK